MDRIETLSCGSIIQHGKFNNRIYLMKAGGDLDPNLPGWLIDMAVKEGYTKIFVKLPGNQAETFLKSGFNMEAAVPGFYNGRESGVFAAYYPDNDRLLEKDKELYEANRELAFNKKEKELTVPDLNHFKICSCTEQDVEEMAGIYKKVFPSYPFPIDKPEYLASTMRDNVKYYCVKDGNCMIALSSSEIDRVGENSEMTDFATLPEWRGYGFGQNLLKYMEKEMVAEGIKIAYTIARAASPGMNITFARLGYTYSGRLINNTNISGNIESMNVWHKSLL